MRHGAANRRSRNRNNGSGGNGGGNGGGGNHNARRGGPQQNRMQVYDSNGPDVRIRGTAYQIQEKYVTLAKDASSAGDRILAESYLQHAEHYQRIINNWQENVHHEGETMMMDRFEAYNQRQIQEKSSASGAQPQSGFGQPPRDEDLGLPSSILGAPRAQQPQPQSPATVSKSEKEFADN